MAGDNLQCRAGTLIVRKVVINGSGGTKTCADFAFRLNGGANTPFEADCQNDLTVNAGTYKVTEPAVAGSVTTYSNCSDVVVPNGGSATCTITNTFVDYGQLAPTRTTCQQYVDGTAVDFDVYYASQGGVIEYTVRSNRINSTNPGVFFYYTGRSQTIAGSGPRMVYIDQGDDSSVVGVLSTTKLDVKPWLVTGTSCQQIQLRNNQIMLGSGANAGDVTVNFTAAAPVGSYYVISVKYDTTSVINTNLGAARPTVKYTFTTNAGGGPIKETDIKGITRAPKP